MSYVNVEQANQRATQLHNQAAAVTQLRVNLEQYRNELGDNWQAAEMTSINQAIGQIISELNGIASELDAMGVDINTRAPQILRQQQFATAQTDLQAAETALRNATLERDRIRGQRDAAVRVGDSGRALLFERQLSTAQNRVNSATNTRNNALNRVRSLS